MNMHGRSFMALLLGAGLFACGASHAGALAGKGVRAGLTVANLRGDFADLVGTDRRFGFAGGGFVRINIPGRVGLQTELLYAMKGATTQVDLTDQSGNVVGTATTTYQFDYLEIPVLLRVTVGGAGPVQPSVLLGPSLGVKLRSRLAYNGPGPFMSGDLNQVEDTDFGLVGGVGLEFGHTPARILLDARYTLGLTNIYTLGLINVVGPPSVVNARTGTFTITAGLGL
jgi:outer membrane protein with beta-barrel domain